MTVLFASRQMFEQHAAALARIAAIDGPRGPLERIEVPEGEGDVRLAPADSERITAGYSGQLSGPLQRRFFGTVRRAPHLEWLHASIAGTDAPMFAELTARGVIVSTSAGANAEAVALTAIGGLLALARGFPAWAEAQARHEWRVRPPEAVPDDLRGQTLLVVGLGAIGGHVARFARALGLTVIGSRRTPASAEDGVDEWVPAARLAAVLPRAQWLAITAPLTAQTRGMIDRAALSRLPRGACVINVSRGAVVDEVALIEALQSGHLRGAYLDVFAEEPLPADSPLWDLPNVIVSPHDAAASRGNSARADVMFLEELE